MKEVKRKPHGGTCHHLVPITAAVTPVMSLKEEMVPIKKSPAWSLFLRPWSVDQRRVPPLLSGKTSVHMFALNSVLILELTGRDKPAEGLSGEIHSSP